MADRTRLGLIALAIGCCFALAACGDDAATDDTATPTPAAAPAATPAPVTPAPAAPVTPAPAPAAAVIPPAPALTPPPAQPAAAVAVASDGNGNYTGTPEAIEGDVIAFGRTRILLYGIDTVEPAQTCFIDGQPWECWPAVVRQLQTLIAEGTVHCAQVGELDVFRRVLALCDVNGQSLNEALVRSGFAIAVPEEMPEYAALEEAARAERIGLWQGQFQLPSDYRLDRGIEVRRP